MLALMVAAAAATATATAEAAAGPPGNATPGGGGCSVSLTHKLSSGACVFGTGFGCFAENSSMWVAAGCRGVFTCNNLPSVKCDPCDGAKTPGCGLATHVCPCAAPPPAPPPAAALLDSAQARGFPCDPRAFPPERCPDGHVCPASGSCPEPGPAPLCSEVKRDTIIGEGQFDIHHARDAAECCARCLATEHCECWTWKTSREHTCLLKNAEHCRAVSHRPAEHRVSGRRPRPPAEPELLQPDGRAAPACFVDPVWTPAEIVNTSGCNGTTTRCAWSVPPNRTNIQYGLAPAPAPGGGLGAGKPERLLLDLYLPPASDTRAKRPGFVLMHGGGFTGGDKARHGAGPGVEAYMAAALAQRGFVAVSINCKIVILSRFACCPSR
eukprot:COSAG04_NODE_29_length_36122_cov_73.422619_11_plen_382_part_00